MGDTGGVLPRPRAYFPIGDERRLDGGRLTGVVDAGGFRAECALLEVDGASVVSLPLLGLVADPERCWASFWEVSLSLGLLAELLEPSELELEVDDDLSEWFSSDRSPAECAVMGAVCRSEVSRSSSLSELDMVDAKLMKISAKSGGNNAMMVDESLAANKGEIPKNFRW